MVGDGVSGGRGVVNAAAGPGRGAARLVAQVSNLLCRRLPAGSAWAGHRLADWKSATQQTGSLRYTGRGFVAQVSNLPCRRLPAGRPVGRSCGWERSAFLFDASRGPVKVPGEPERNEPILARSPTVCLTDSTRPGVAAAGNGGAGASNQRKNIEHGNY